MSRFDKLMEEVNKVDDMLNLKEADSNFAEKVHRSELEPGEEAKSFGPLYYSEAFDLDGNGFGIRNMEQFNYYYKLLTSREMSEKVREQVGSLQSKHSLQEIFWGVFWLVKKEDNLGIKSIDKHALGILFTSNIIGKAKTYFLGLRDDRRRVIASIEKSQKEVADRIKNAPLISIMPEDSVLQNKTIKRQEQKTYQEVFTWVVDGKVLTTMGGAIIEEAPEEQIKQIITQEEVKAKRPEPTKYIFRDMPMSENLIPTPLLKKTIKALEQATEKASYGWVHLGDGRMVDGHVYTLLREMGREPRNIQEYSDAIKMVQRLSAARASEGL